MSAPTSGTAAPTSTLSRSKQISAIRLRSKNDEEGEVKRTLARGSDDCWLNTSGARIKVRARDGYADYQCTVLKYDKKGSRTKGHRKYGATRDSELKAEDALFHFRYNLESKKSKELVDAELKKRLGKESDAGGRQSERAASAAMRSADDEQPEQKKIRRTVSSAMSANPCFRINDPLGNWNPNTPGVCTSSNVCSTDRSASAAPSPSMRTNVLCLGVSYPCIKSQLRAQGVDPRVMVYSNKGVDQIVELVQRSILTEMDGRDMVRCLTMEEGNNTMAYCVSLGNGAEYGERHLHANFNRVKLIARMKKTWDGVKFRQIILDYFWIPRGTWVMSHWSRSFFDAILPSFVTEGMIDFSCSDEVGSRKVNSRLQADSTSGSGGGVVYLPFCFHCVKEVTAAIDILSKYYTISFLHKSELAEHALWSATNSIDPNVMQLQFGKAIAQEEIYCKFKPQEAYSAAEDAHITKKEVIQVLRRIEDFEDIRMIKLTVLKKYDPEYRGSTASGMVGVTKGGYVGLKDPSEVVRGFNHVGKATKKPSTKAQQPVAVPVSVPAASAPAKDDGKNTEKPTKRMKTPAKGAKPSAAKKAAAKAKAKARTEEDEISKKPRANKKMSEKKRRADKSCSKMPMSTPAEMKKIDGVKKLAPKKSLSQEKIVDQSDAVNTVEVDMMAVTPSVGAPKQKSMAGVRKSPRASSAGLGLVTPSPAQMETSGQDATTTSSSSPAEKSTDVVTQNIDMPSPASSTDQSSMVSDNSSDFFLCPSLKSTPDVSEDDTSEVEISVPSPTLRTPMKKSKEVSDEGSGTKVKRAGGKRKKIDSSCLEFLPEGKPRSRPRQPFKKRKHTKKGVESVLETAGFATRRSPRKTYTANESSVSPTPVLRRSPRKSQDPHISVVYPPISVTFPPGGVLANVGVQKESTPTKNQDRQAPRKRFNQRAKDASAEKRRVQERLIGESRARVLADLGRTSETLHPLEESVII